VKILYHHRTSSKDGQYVHIEELIGALEAAGHEVVMAGPSEPEGTDFGGGGGLVGWLRRRLPGALVELMELGYAVLDYTRLARRIRAERPDWIYERYNLYLPSGIWAKRRFGLPLLLEVNAPLFAERSAYGGLALKGLARWTERYAWRGADRVLAVTRVLADLVAAEGVPEDRIRVVPNGVNPKRFPAAADSEALRARLGLKERTVLGFTGFLRAWHGVENTVRLLAEDGAADRHLLVVGDGPARPDIERAARESGVADRVTVTGVVPRSQVAAHVALFDVALQPAVVAYASPLKLFEYLAMGRAIVAPATPNIREILVDGDNALLFPPGDDAAFRAAVRRLCGDSDLRARLGARARATIEERGLTWAHNAETVTALAAELLAGARAA
jgi:glycosyltransferase involved in cell wall biosynthesis